MKAVTRERSASGASGSAPKGLDDRSPCGAVLALIKTIIEYSDDLRTDWQVMDAIVEKQGPARRSTPV